MYKLDWVQQGKSVEASEQLDMQITINALGLICFNMGNSKVSLKVLRESEAKESHLISANLLMLATLRPNSLHHSVLSRCHMTLLCATFSREEVS